MSNIVVGMADLNVGKDGDVLVTYGLGSCVGLVLYDAASKIGGMAHIMLPSSSINTDVKSRAKFADTAIEEVIKKIRDMGVPKSRLKAKIAGGASMFTASSGSPLIIKAGQNNIDAVTKILAKEGIPIIAKDVGGNKGRTIKFDMSNGQLSINMVGQSSKII